MTNINKNQIAIINFGGQYAHLIAKRIRKLGVTAHILSPRTSLNALESVCGMIWSGGPGSVLGNDAIDYNPALLNAAMPILGLCYGHQLMAHLWGGEVKVASSEKGGEYGRAQFQYTGTNPVFKKLNNPLQVWMSHGDSVISVPPHFHCLGHTQDCTIAAMAHDHLPLVGLQFHPEVTDTEQGSKLLENFVVLCGAEGNWSIARYLDEQLEACRTQVGNKQVLMFLSGGVDSTVTYALLRKSIPASQLRGVFIDTGFLRQYEAKQVMESYQNLGFMEVEYLDASERFLKAVKQIVDPQQKREAIGRTFLEVREAWLSQAGVDAERAENWLLGQGTLYPDIVESGSVEHAATIKSHHNRAGGIDVLLKAGLVVEPLKELYKDEVRELGRLLELPAAMIERHPFPGPGLAINIIGSKNNQPPTGFAEASIELAKAMQTLPACADYHGVLLPVCSVGVQGDQRTYTHPAVLSGALDWDKLERCSTAITNQVSTVNRVVVLIEPAKLPSLKLYPADCSPERLTLLREADHLTTTMLQQSGWYQKIFQLLVILLPLSGTTEHNNPPQSAVVLRPVCSEDVMTAQFAPIPTHLVKQIAKQLMQNEHISAVLYDVTHKPPGTFGWE